ncbi:MAG: hypothetical protein L3J98_14070 [Gammaproteobacteria bacterium]|nr:hypothetical protein [Gammaproteobacteria bacterium]
MSLPCLVEPLRLFHPTRLTKIMMPFPHLSTRLIYFPILFLVLLSLILQGCDGGENNANPVGYFTDIGIANVDNDAGKTIKINDLQGVVMDDNIMMMSMSHKIVYDGIITNINGNYFTADFIIFVEDKNPTTATANGIITEGSKIEGRLTGSGVGNGTFSLFSMPNEQVDISNAINELQEMLDDNQN